MVIFGGWDAQITAPLASLEIYNKTSNTWTAPHNKTLRMPEARVEPAVARMGTTMYLFAGEGAHFLCDLW